jgi:hypothetical protein
MKTKLSIALIYICGGLLSGCAYVEGVRYDRHAAEVAEKNQAKQGTVIESQSAVPVAKPALKGGAKAAQSAGTLVAPATR